MAAHRILTLPSLGLATLPAYPDADDEVDSVVIQVYATSARRSHEIADAYRRRGVRGDGGTARDVDSTRGRRPPASAARQPSDQEVSGHKSSISGSVTRRPVGLSTALTWLGGTRPSVPSRNPKAQHTERQNHPECSRSGSGTDWTFWSQDYIAAMLKSAWTWIWLAALGFAIGFPLMKAMFESGMDLWQILVPRYVIGTAAIALISRSRSFDCHHPDARTQGMVLGVIGVSVPTILMSIGTDLLPSSVAGVLTAFIPTATVAAAHLVVPGERFSARRLPGLMLATAGVIMLVLGGRTDAGTRISLLGVAVFLGGVFLAGVGGALNRRFAISTPATALVLPQFLAASTVVGLIGLPLGGSQLGDLSTTQWVQVVAFGLVCTALPFFALLKASELASAAKASLIGYIVPLLAAVLAVTFLGDPLSTALMLGGGLIVAGVYAADRTEKRIAIPV